MDVRTYPDAVLRRRAEPVTSFDAPLADLARGMVEAMRASRGLGLAAPQVGVSRRVIVVSPDAEADGETVMINPEIVGSDGWVEGEEGCLSFPGIYVKIGRFARVVARYQDTEGRSHEMRAEGLLARAVQHEIDHLEGRLLVDRMSMVQRMANRRGLRELERRSAGGAEKAPAGAGEGG